MIELARQYGRYCNRRIAALLRGAGYPFSKCCAFVFRSAGNATPPKGDIVHCAKAHWPRNPHPDRNRPIIHLHSNWTTQAELMTVNFLSKIGALAIQGNKRVPLASAETYMGGGLCRIPTHRKSCDFGNGIKSILRNRMLIPSSPRNLN